MVLWVCGAILVGSGIGAFQQAGRPKMEFVAGDTDKSPAPNAPKPASAVPGGQASAVGVLPDGRIDLNTADERLLDTLDGIGPAKARAIVENRLAHGPFRTVQELDRVKGIGPAMLSKIAAKVAVQTTSPAGLAVQNAVAPDARGREVGGSLLAGARFTPSGAMPKPAAVANQAQVPAVYAPPTRPVSPVGPVNINTADMAQLMSLKYVGEARARAILQHRSVHGLFPTPESLDAVKGIGRQVLDANRGRIVVR